MPGKRSPLGNTLSPSFVFSFEKKGRRQEHIHIVKFTKLQLYLWTWLKLYPQLLFIWWKITQSNLRAIGQERPPEKNNSRLGSRQIQDKWGKSLTMGKWASHSQGQLLWLFRWTEYVNAFEPEKPYKEITFHFLRKFYYALFKWPKLQGARRDY